jgi:hypothetical protein
MVRCYQGMAPFFRLAALNVTVDGWRVMPLVNTVDCHLQLLNLYKTSRCRCTQLPADKI